MTITHERHPVRSWTDLESACRPPAPAPASRGVCSGPRSAGSTSRVHLAPGTSYPAETLGRGGPEMHVYRPDEMFARIARDKLIGFGEAYLTGAWDEGPSRASATSSPCSARRSRRWCRARCSGCGRSSCPGSPGRTGAAAAPRGRTSRTTTTSPTTCSRCSSTRPCPTRPRCSTTRPWRPPPTSRRAQHRKIDRLLDQAGVGEGTRLLEIGTGWGELAIRAAERGATVHSITLSSEQLALARDRIAAGRQADRVEVELLDYRALLVPTGRGVRRRGVGRDDRGGGLAVLADVLPDPRPRARAGRTGRLQAITMPHDRMLATRDTHTFITKYIFPGGALPSVRAIEETAARTPGSGSWTRCRWARTMPGRCGCGTTRSLRPLPTVGALGFDETFRRLWHFYLEYSRAGFASGYIDDHQITLARGRIDS